MNGDRSYKSYVLNKIFSKTFLRMFTLPLTSLSLKNNGNSAWISLILKIIYAVCTYENDWTTQHSFEKIVNEV